MSAYLTIEKNQAYAHYSERDFEYWLKKQGVKNIRECDKLVYQRDQDGKVLKYTLVDFTLPDHNAYIELTSCQWGHRVEGSWVGRHHRVLRFKRARAKLLQELGYTYILIEGDFYRRLVRGCPKAKQRFFEMLKGTGITPGPVEPPRKSSKRSRRGPRAGHQYPVRNRNRHTQYA